jgi:hypothetical protein
VRPWRIRNGNFGVASNTQAAINLLDSVLVG